MTFTRSVRWHIFNIVCSAMHAKRTAGFYSIFQLWYALRFYCVSVMCSAHSTHDTSCAKMCENKNLKYIRFWGNYFDAIHSAFLSLTFLYSSHTRALKMCRCKGCNECIRYVGNKSSALFVYVFPVFFFRFVFWMKACVFFHIPSGILVSFKWCSELFEPSAKKHKELNKQNTHRAWVSSSYDREESIAKTEMGCCLSSMKEFIFYIEQITIQTNKLSITPQR